MTETKNEFTIHSSPMLDVKIPSPRDGSCEKFQDGESERPSPYSGEIDGIYVIGLSQEELAFYSTFTPKMRRALNRKIDIRLLPILALLYLISNLDRANIGNAKIEGMEASLSLTGVQYNTALAIFFVSYILFGTSSLSVSQAVAFYVESYTPHTSG